METAQEQIDYTIEYTVEDLLDLPVHRVELDDGKINPTAPSRAWHFDSQRRPANAVGQRFPRVSGEILIRITKLVRYARAGIPEYRLVEQIGKSGDAEIHCYRLDSGASGYRLAETTTLSELEKSAG